MVSPCCTPLLVLAFFVYVDCHQAAGVDAFQEFDVHVFYPLFLKRGRYFMCLR